MPKLVRYILAWSPEETNYRLIERDAKQKPLLKDNEEAWFAWLHIHTSFAFHGQNGRINVLKEHRPRGEEGYWYAYQRQGKRMLKKYLGHSHNLNIQHLEEVARALTNNSPTASQSPTQSSLDVPLSSPGLLLSTKLQPPQPHSSLIPRKHLLARLNGALERKLTLLSAPAGFGKTTLMGQWLAGLRASQPETASVEVAWLSLDHGDNDPIRFWHYLTAACKPFLEDQGKAVIALLSKTVPFEQTHLEEVQTTFLNSCIRPGLLILEDFHVINEPAIHKSLAFMLEHIPPSLHLIIIARGEPPFPLARLRATADLDELNTTDLRFSPEEIAAFFARTTSFPLSLESLLKLEARLKGWPAGLRLLAFTLQHCSLPQDAEQALAAFTGSQRPVLEYFISEVLNTQSEQLQAYLLATSVLTRLTGSLCDAITGDCDSARLLSTLHQGGFFLERLDESWFRYYTLFAEAMRYEAHRRLEATTLRDLHSRASRWYEQHGMLTESIESALNACDWERAAYLIDLLLESESFNEIHEYHTLHRWLKEMPETLLARHPMLCLNYASSELFVTSNRLTPATMSRIEDLLNMAEYAFEEQKDDQRLGMVFSFRSLVAWRQEDFMGMELYARQALSLLPYKERDWQSLSLSILARKELHFGQLNDARQALHDARALCKDNGNHYFLRATANMLGGICFDQGELHQAREYYNQVLTQARARQDLDDAGYALLGLASLSYEWNDLNTAWQEAEEVLTLGRQLSHEGHIAHAEILLARIQLARGEEEQARQRLTTHLAHMRSNGSPSIYREILFWQARLALAVGDLAAAHLSLDNLNNLTPTSIPARQEQASILCARLLIMSGAPQEALIKLMDLLNPAQEAGRVQRALEIQILIALAHNALKQAHEARQWLRNILPFVRSEGFKRLFLDEGEAVAGVLRSIVAHESEKVLKITIQRLLSYFSSSQGTPKISGSPPLPLSGQESRVLRLLVAGRTNPEIARELVVSVNTVRTQVQSIYRKLDVNNRVSASEAARLHGLI
ncbi:LuxR C-terminal-related transcriptional regulator [Ktedonospora formicarum]|uniref:LuxR family transcriptional regulator n=1 Tax=Ktedonospora formicarum TaxID=2778364 RepID=A0A8J3I5G9_9CHLR|nr:LuxR C-terminal-related transcriptional regulator [Ktedonospora formicarum]GHO46263.1 LuxR family transcriptional regulator [Ktedonospora formicarum]